MPEIPYTAWRFGLGLGISAVLGWAALTWVGPRGFMDCPKGRKAHKGAVPQTGGLTFVITMLIGLGFHLCVLPFNPLQWVGVVVMAGMGLLDDRFCLRPRTKALVGLLVSVPMAYVGALSVLARHTDVHLLNLALPASFPIFFTLLLLYFWCVPQSFNLVDGLNGLAIGYTLVVLGALGLTGFVHPFTLGAVTGLLVWNWPRARHFLGDCGSMSIGLLLALLVKQSYAHQDPNLILWIFAYPLLDTTMVVVVRLAKGLHPARADRSHLHHRWQDVLANRPEWVLPLLLMQAAACASAVVAQGWGWVIPGAGLTALLVQAFWFSLRDLRAHRRNTLKPLREAPDFVVE